MLVGHWRNPRSPHAVPSSVEWRHGSRHRAAALLFQRGSVRALFPGRARCDIGNSHMSGLRRWMVWSDVVVELLLLGGLLESATPRWTRTQPAPSTVSCAPDPAPSRLAPDLTGRYLA